MQGMYCTEREMELALSKMLVDAAKRLMVESGEARWAIPDFCLEGANSDRIDEVSMELARAELKAVNYYRARA